MHRRAFLAVAGTSVLSGCGLLAGESNPPPSRSEGESTPTASQSDAGSSSATSRFEGEPCTEAFGDRATCYHSVSEPGWSLVLRPDRERVTDPSRPLTFTFENGRFDAVRVLLTFPVLYRRVAGEWYRIPSRRQDSGGVAKVRPGDSLRFALVSKGSQAGDVDGGLVQRYGGGQFAFGVLTYSPRRTVLARFVVEADPLSLSLPGNVTTTRDDAVVTVRHDRLREDDQTLTLEIKEHPDAADPVRLPAELFRKTWELRTVALLEREDVSKVVVRSEHHSYFRTPVEWLEDAGAWQGQDVTYAVGSTAFTLSQESVSD